jgi:hypothetical protein
MTAGDVQTFYVTNYQENEQVVSFVLRSALEVASVKLPKGRLSFLMN